MALSERPRRGWRFGALALMAGCVVTSSGLAVAVTPSHRHDATHASAPARFFSPRSPWNAPLAPSASVDPGSQRMLQGLTAEVAAEEAGHHGPWINTNAWSVPVYTVARRDRTTRVLLDHAPDPALSRAFSRVPLPRGAHPAGGTDRHLVVYQPSTDRMWEFFGLTRRGGRWHTNWGGAMRHVSKNRGVFGRRSWPGAKPWWGATATSLPLVGGLMRIDELEAGHIDHALAIALPQVRAGVWSSPARRGDGNVPGDTAIPEGAKLRLDPNLDLSQLPMSPLTRMMAAAAQRYGIIVRDRAGVITFVAEDPTPRGGTNPYTNNPTGIGPLAGGLFDGRWPSTLMASFPWSHLEVLRLSLHSR